MGRSVDAVSAGLKKVPPFPPVAAKLLQLLTNSEVDLTEVAELVNTDATFTARLLQRVNSVGFGMVSPVTNIRQAVTLLGIDLTRQVIVSHATSAYIEGALGTEELQRCWQHSVATAVLAEELAQACGAFTQSAFTAGIMHDIGRLGLLVAYPADYERVIRDAATRCLDLMDFEKEEFGLDHEAAGRTLAAQWGLPVELCIVAGRHHDRPDGASLDLLQIVHTACRLSDVLGYYVVTPLGHPDIEAVLSEFPSPKQIRIDPVEMRSRIDKQISQYSSVQAVVPPEVSLALLAPAPTDEPAPYICDVPEVKECEAHTKSSKGRWVPIALALAGVVAAALFLLWRFR